MKQTVIYSRHILTNFSFSFHVMLSDTFRENKASLGCQSGDRIGTKSPQSSLKWKFRAGHALVLLSKESKMCFKLEN